MSSTVRALAALVVLLTATVVHADSAESTAAAQEPSDADLPAEADETRGTCLTPRQAWLQLLYWTQASRYDPVKASVCFDKTRLADKQDAAGIARQLKEILDANGWWIKSHLLPTDHNYTDPRTGTQTYIDPAVEGAGIIVQKSGGLWLFTPDTLDAVPGLYPGVIARIVRSLPNWFQSRAFGVEVWKYLGVVILIFLAMLVQRTSVFVIRHYLKQLISKTNIQYLDQAIAEADRPIGGLVMAGIFYVGFPLLLFPVGIARIALIATHALAAYSMVWLGYRFIDILKIWMMAKAEATESKLDDQLVPLITRTLKVFVSVIGGIFVLQNLDVDVSSLIAGLGIGGLAFAFAAKDTIANFFGSVMIFLDKPFQIGDWVAMAGVEGIVEEVGFRTTRVRTFYNSLVTVPNSLVTGNTVDNFGARKYRRYSTTLGLAYDTPPEKVQAFCETLRAAIKGTPGMRQDYYLVEFKEFADYSLNIMLYCFMVSDTWNDELRTRTNLNLEILRIAHSLGVSFAFPTQTLHVDTLAKAGEANPSFWGPASNEELVAIARGFAPGGSMGRPDGLRLSRGYYCGDEFDPDTTAGRGGDG